MIQFGIKCSVEQVLEVNRELQPLEQFYRDENTSLFRDGLIDRSQLAKNQHGIKRHMEALFAARLRELVEQGRK